jgi:cytochrome c oxidase assembly protein subunit 15
VVKSAAGRIECDNPSGPRTSWGTRHPLDPVNAFHYFSRALVVATLILVAAGGMVTSTNSGLSVPDWPTTYGQNMFTFPLSGMVGGIFYEHGHRLIASGVGFLTIGLVFLATRVEPRRWVRRLAWIALGVVVLQGTLGGLTVLFLLPDAISIGHAGLAQIFFGLTVTVALVTSRSWREGGLVPYEARALAPHMAALTALVYLQILLGATMRHTGAGLAIPDFPLAYGRLIPPFWTTPIALHFAHRVGALTILVLVIFNVVAIRRALPHAAEFIRPAWILVAAVATQVTLGAFVVLTGKQPIVNTAHVAIGATVLASSLVLTLRCYRSGAAAVVSR